MIYSVINHQAEEGESNILIKNTNPSTGADRVAWPSATPEQVDRAVAAARAAFAAWSRTSMEEREAILHRYAGMAGEHKEEMAGIICTEAGKPLWEARQEAGAVVGKIELAIKAHAERCGEFGSGPARTRFRPHGVLAVLGPFNFPAHLANGHIVPALLAGNTVVLKPSERVPSASSLMMRWWQDAGLPAGVLNLVQGDGSVGAALAGHADLNGLLFTGGSAVGEALRRDFGSQPGKMLALELGGNNPLVVWEPGNLELAANQIVQSAYITAGQRCTCSRRLIIPTGAAGDAVIDALLVAMDTIQVGPADRDPAVFMGPVINAAAAQELVAQQDKLIAAGAISLRRLKHLIPATGLVSPGLLDVTAIKDMADEEHFGPLLKVHRVADFDAALTEANRTAYGLSAGLLSDQAELYERFRNEVRAGIINWNTATTGASGAAPFGGLGLSGNFRPSGYFAADYCSYAVASMEKDQLDPEAPLPPGLRTG